MRSFELVWKARPNEVVELPNGQGRAYQTGCSLGEGPLWHDPTGQLIWFDIKTCEMLRFDPETGTIDAARLPVMPSAAAIMGDDALLVAAEDGLYLMPVEGGECRGVLPIEHDDPTTRSNDSRVDFAGYFWIGTMGRDGQDGAGAQYRLAPDGTLETLFEHVSVPNSTAFDARVGRAWIADSRTRVIRSALLETATGALGAFSPFAEVTPPAVPDGSICDADGALWTALWGGGCVVRWSNDGNIARRVDLPASLVTCPAFGGPQMGTLFVTSARADLNGAPEAAGAYDGALFALNPDALGSGVHGAPEARYTPKGWLKAR